MIEGEEQDVYGARLSVRWLCPLWLCFVHPFVSTRLFFRNDFSERGGKCGCRACLDLCGVWSFKCRQCTHRWISSLSFSSRVQFFAYFGPIFQANPNTTRRACVRRALCALVSGLWSEGRVSGAWFPDICAQFTYTVIIPSSQTESLEVCVVCGYPLGWRIVPSINRAYMSNIPASLH